MSHRVVPRRSSPIPSITRAEKPFLIGLRGRLGRYVAGSLRMLQATLTSLTPDLASNHAQSASFTIAPGLRHFKTVRPLALSGACWRAPTPRVLVARKLHDILRRETPAACHGKPIRDQVVEGTVRVEHPLLLVTHCRMLDTPARAFCGADRKL